MSQITTTTQQDRNQALIARSRYMRPEVTSSVLPFRIDTGAAQLSAGQVLQLQALEIEAARIAIRSVGELAKLGEVDHLGGSLDIIPTLLMTLGMVDYQKVEFTIENAHTSIGYYSSLAALGYLDPDVVIKEFRCGLDIPGHVSWVPGGTQLNGGRLGVMVPAAVGQALGKKAHYGSDAWVICACGDAGWISGQALNGFNAADLHDAPVTFVMQRNGIQLSGSNKAIMDKDPRPIIEAMGVSILEVASVHDEAGLFAAMKEARSLAARGEPTMIYPVGYGCTDGTKETLSTFAARYGIEAETEAFAKANGVAMDKAIWTPGAMMSYRDVQPMLECLFLVNGLPGGAGHHDGSLKGRDAEEVIANPMLQFSPDQQAALDALRAEPKVKVTTKARPHAGSPNLQIPSDQLAAVVLPEVGKKTSARAGVEAGYAAVAEANPDKVFVVSCDVDPSTKLGKARSFLPREQQFELSIEEQAATIMANGIATATRDPQLVVFSTFAAFYEGIAREGMEMWRYQRNLNGANEGLNVTFHLSHVGACTGRDHFSGWSLDWITLAIGYLPYLHRFYTPCDARSAFVAIRDLAANYGGHIIGIPRDNLPVLADAKGKALWEADTEWEAITVARKNAGAKKAVLAVGATAFIAIEAAEKLTAGGEPTDVLIINGLPLAEGTLDAALKKYECGLVTVEDGLIGNGVTGLRGFAGLVSSYAYGSALAHVGIEDPTIAPSDGHMEVWEHFGITAEAIQAAVQSL
jgi:transketolase